MTQLRRDFTNKSLHHLDELDVRILRELRSPGSPQWNVRVSFSSISKRLGVDEETVRRRVQLAREKGYFPAWRIMVNPRLIGCEAAGLDAEVTDEVRKTSVISQLTLVDGVTYILDCRGGELSVGMYYESDDSLERKTKLISSICCSPKITGWRSVFPPPRVRMRKLDWGIVEAMGEDAGRNLEDVANSLGVSVRTVRRRLSTMEEGKAIYLVGIPKPEMIVGLLCKFLVFSQDQPTKRAADKTVLSMFRRIGFSDTTPDGYSIFGMACGNLSEADQIMGRLKEFFAVKGVKMAIVKEFIAVQNWLDGEIRKRRQEF